MRMRSLRTITLIVPALAALLMASCYQCKESAFDPATGAWADYTAGTAWIYQDDSTGRLDTFLCEESVHGYLDRCEGKEGTGLNFEYRELSGSNPRRGLCSLYVDAEHNKIIAQASYNDELRLWTDFDPAGVNPVFHARHDSLSVCGKWYYGVYEVHQDSVVRYFHPDGFCIRVNSLITGKSISLYHLARRFNRN